VERNSGWWAVELQPGSPTGICRVHPNHVSLEAAKWEAPSVQDEQVRQLAEECGGFARI